MRVKNIQGTSQNSCKCGSWLDHWKKFSRQTLSQYCSEKNCTKKPEVGAHVQKDSSDNSWYIVPLCHEHNKKTTALDLVDSVALVSANVSGTCG